ncbi:hypothetical protein ACWC4E_01915 [Streptomyces sp. NPDC001273]
MVEDARREAPAFITGPFVMARATTRAAVASSGGAGEAGMPWWAFAPGAGPVGNVTIIAASAPVVVIGIAGSEGHHISSWQFSRYGLIVTAVTVTVAAAYVWLRYFVLV